MRYFIPLKLIRCLLLLSIGLWLLFPAYNVLAAEIKNDHLAVWAEQQNLKFGKLIGKYLKQEKQALASLEKSRSVLTYAKEINDKEAEAIAQKAVALSEKAIANIRSKRLANEARIRAIEKACRIESKIHFAVASKVNGRVYKKTKDGWDVLDLNTPLSEGDEIRTESDGFIEAILTDGSMIKLGADSTFKIARLGEKTSIYEMIKGRIHAEYVCIYNTQLPCSRSLRIHTSKVNIAVRGTEFSIEAQPNSPVKVIVLEGVIELSEPDDSGDGRTIMVRAGEMAAVGKDGSITGPAVIKAGSLKRWWE